MDSSVQRALIKDYRRADRYYRGDINPKILGIAIPAHLRHFKPSVGWAKIGIDKFCDRVIPARFDTAGIVDIRIQLDEAVKSAVKYGISYLIVYEDTRDGIWRVRVANPLLSFADIDPRRRTVTAYYEIEKKPGDDYALYSYNGLANIVPLIRPFGFRVFPIVHQQDTANIYGQSRITKPVRDLIDSAIRTLARSEIAAEFYSFPQAALLGADLTQFDVHPGLEDSVKDFSAGIGHLLLFPTHGETGQTPTLQQLDQQSFSPHTDQLDHLARLCAAELNIDVSELGIYQTNPTSADALYSSKEDLVLEVKSFEQVNNDSIEGAIQALIEGNGLESEPKMVWREPATPSMASQADAFIKLVAAIPSLAVSQAGLRLSGLSEEAIAEVTGELFD